MLIIRTGRASAGMAALKAAAPACVPAIIDPCPLMAGGTGQAFGHAREGLPETGE